MSLNATDMEILWPIVYYPFAVTSCFYLVYLPMFWPRMLTSCIDHLLWPCILTSCTDLMFWPYELISCNDLVYWPRVPTCSTEVALGVAWWIIRSNPKAKPSLANMELPQLFDMGRFKYSTAAPSTLLLY